MDGGDVRLTIDAKVATITIGTVGEKRTTMSCELVAQVARTCAMIEGDDAVRCIVFAGVGADFMVGGDVRHFEEMVSLKPSEVRARLEEETQDSEALWAVLSRMPQPVVASLRGNVVGGAIAFATCADLVIVSDTARFVVAQPRLGLSVDVTMTYFLPHLIGLNRAKELAFLGETIDADRAERLGLVNWVVPDRDLESRTLALAQRLAAAAPVALRETKSLMNAAMTTPFATQVLNERQSTGITAQTADFREGVMAFLEKRPAEFRGF